MVHDFLVTRRHALFPILPLTGSLERAMSGAPPFAWEPDKGSLRGGDGAATPAVDDDALVRPPTPATSSTR